MFCCHPNKLSINMKIPIFVRMVLIIYQCLLLYALFLIGDI